MWRGWLKSLLIKHNFLKEGKENLWNNQSYERLLYQCQLVAMEMTRAIQGSDYKDPRLVTEHGVYKDKLDGRFQKKKTGIPTGIFTVPYLLYAYEVLESSFKRKRVEMKEGKISRPPAEQAMHHRGTSVINNSLLSKERHNASYFFVRQKVLAHEPPAASYKGCWVTHMDRQRY